MCDGEEGSCHKFRCKQRKDLGIIDNQSEVLPRNVDYQNFSRSSDFKIEENNTWTTQIKPSTQDLCDCKSSLMILGENSFDQSNNSQEMKLNGAEYSPRSNCLDCGETSNNLEQKRRSTSKDLSDSQNMSNTRTVLKPFDSLTSPHDNSEISQLKKSQVDLCSCQDSEAYAREGYKLAEELIETSSIESYHSVGTAITPRQTKDEDVIPLLKNIYNVLQMMREEKEQLGPLAMKNIEIELDEPFNGLPSPAPPPSSTSLPLLKERKQISSVYRYKSPRARSQYSVSCLELEEEITKYIQDQSNSMDILEPPERDMDNDYEDYQHGKVTSQRLIPVDMELLRTVEESIWEPVSITDSIDVAEKKSFSEPAKDSLEDVELLKAQFLQFPEEPFSQSSEVPNVYLRNSSCHRDGQNNVDGRSQDDNEESCCQLPTPEKSKESCECLCENLEKCASDCCREISITKSYSNDKNSTPTLLKPSTHDENEQTVMKIKVSQAVQVNIASLQNMITCSTQSLTALDSQIYGQSEEKLKTSKIDESNEIQPYIPLDNTAPAIIKLDIGTDNPGFGDEEKHSTKSDSVCCHCHLEPNKPQNQEMSNFIESILFDLKAMKNFRENNFEWQSCSRQPVHVPTGGWQRPSKDLSFPVTIETVQELGHNSLFIKWKVRNIGNIGGYEIFLDGHLTNRYFNCIHRAAVICDVNLQYPHRITLRAQPLLPINTSLMMTTNSRLLTSSSTLQKCPSNITHPEASCPQPDGSVWYPSVYHFEPNSYSAPINAVLY